MAIMPGADRSQRFSGNRHRAPITKIVLHTTEGSSWPGYGGGGSAPHFTVRPGPATKQNIRQHIDTAQSSKALENRSGGVQTNNAGVVQIEFIGSCDRAYARKHGLFFTENATDSDLAALAAVFAWIHKTHGVHLNAPGLSWPNSNAAYLSAPQRMSFAKWNAFKGVCGHTHVPENTHWDPGRFPIDRLLRLARAAAGGGGVPVGGGTGASSSLATGSPGKPWTTSPRVNGFTKAEITSIQNELVGAGYSIGSHGVDGKYGDGTGEAVKQLQRDLGVTADGVYGPGTEKALMAMKDDVAWIRRVVEENQRRIDAVEGKVKAAIDYHVPRVTFLSGLTDDDGNALHENLAQALRRVNKHTSWNNVKNDRAEAKIDALLDAVKQLPDIDIDVDAIREAAKEGAKAGAASASAEDVAELLTVGVRDDAGDSAQS